MREIRRLFPVLVVSVPDSVVSVSVLFVCLLNLSLENLRVHNCVQYVCTYVKVTETYLYSGKVLDQFHIAQHIEA